VTAEAPTAQSSIAPAPVASEPAPTGSASVEAPPPSRVSFERVVARVGQNHGHVFSVTIDDVRKGVDKTYDLTGSAPHAHTITLTAADFGRLTDGEIVRTVSSRTGHAHRLLVKLAPAVDPPETVNVCETKVGGKDDHELVVTAPDMAASVDKTFDIQGIADHNHRVVISAGDFAKLHTGTQLVLESGIAEPGEDHSHRVYVSYSPKKT
jgi:hypothetical protein